jgi:YVTN family beta-propeller protein
MRNKRQSSFPKILLVTAMLICAGAFTLPTQAQDKNQVAKVEATTSPLNQLVATIPVGVGPFGIAVSPDNDFVYVANSMAQTVSVINTSTNTVVTTYGLPYAGALAVSADGSTLYVTSAIYTSWLPGANTLGNQGNAVAAVSTANGNILKTFTVEQDPDALALSPDGKQLWVVNAAVNGGNISIIDVANQTVESKTIDIGGFPFFAAFSPSGKDFYAGPNALSPKGGEAVSLISASSHKVLNKTIGKDGKPVVSAMSLAVSPNGKKLYLSVLASPNLLDISTSGYRVKKALTESVFLAPIAVTPNSQYLYGMDNDDAAVLYTFDTKTDQPVGSPLTLNTSLAGAFNMVISPNGNYLYVADLVNDVVYVVDIASS